MKKLEVIDATNWKDFVDAPLSMLMLGKSDCAACNEWTEELTAFLESDEELGEVRFGKMLLDQRGLHEFKKASPWLKDVDVLPYNVFFQAGEPKKNFAGKGIERMKARLVRIREGE
jgi:hypothetical protein